MKKSRKAKKRPARQRKKRKPSLDVNQMAAKLVQKTIKDSER